MGQSAPASQGPLAVSRGQQASHTFDRTSRRRGWDYRNSYRTFHSRDSSRIIPWEREVNNESPARGAARISQIRERYAVEIDASKRPRSWVCLLSQVPKAGPGAPG